MLVIVELGHLELGGGHYKSFLLRTFEIFCHKNSRSYAEPRCSHRLPASAFTVLARLQGHGGLCPATLAHTSRLPGVSSVQA
jgi:hypothetical protein